MTESPVGVAERGDRVADRPSVSAKEEPLEAPTVEDPGVAGEKPGGGVEVGGRHRADPNQVAPRGLAHSSSRGSPQSMT